MMKKEKTLDDFRCVQIGDCTLYQGDCLEIMPLLPKFDAVVTDPPYGIQENSRRVASRGKLAKTIDYGSFDWDRETKPAAINMAIAKSKNAIVFGGNYYDLPPTRCFLVWDKLNGGNDFADCELAWTNLKMSVRRISFLWNGMIRREKHILRQHPTQKPVEVMKWCLGFIPEAKTILDPFMGSGTTGVACAKMGRKFTGIELDPKYFDIACERIIEADKQPDLFIESEKQTPHEQIELTELLTEA